MPPAPTAYPKIPDERRATRRRRSCVLFTDPARHFESRHNTEERTMDMKAEPAVSWQIATLFLCLAALLISLLAPAPSGTCGRSGMSCAMIDSGERQWM